MNPGEKYRFTRHNAGAMALDLLFPDAAYKYDSAIEALSARLDWEGFDTYLLKPQTFMNLSGQGVGKALRKFGVEQSALIVLHDEVELPAGEVRFKSGGGHKGHNGLRSIIAVLGHRNFHRVRIGVGRPEDDSRGIADYLLSFQPAGERAQLDTLKRALGEAIRAINIA